MLPIASNFRSTEPIKEKINTLKLFFKLSFYLFLLFSTLLSCSVKYLPIVNEIYVHDRYALLTYDDLTLAIKHKSWSMEPAMMNSYFTTFHIIVRNNSTEPIEFDKKNVFLIDSYGNQNDVIEMNEVLDLISIYSGGFPLSYKDLDEYNQRQKDLLESRRNIVQNSFSSGKIFPNAQRSGFIYFNKIQKSDKFTIYYKDKEVVFEKVVNSIFRK